MARPGYLEARKARDKEFQLLQEAERRLIEVDTLEDSDFKPLSADLKEVHRKDAKKAVEEHKERLARAEAAFNLFAKPLPPPKPPRTYYVAVINARISTTKAVFDEFYRRCEQEGITPTELIRKALDAYLFPSGQTPPNPPPSGSEARITTNAMSAASAANATKESNDVEASAPAVTE